MTGNTVFVLLLRKLKLGDIQWLSDGGHDQGDDISNSEATLQVMMEARGPPIRPHVCHHRSPGNLDHLLKRSRMLSVAMAQSTWSPFMLTSASKLPEKYNKLSETQLPSGMNRGALDHKGEDVPSIATSGQAT